MPRKLLVGGILAATLAPGFACAATPRDTPPGNDEQDEIKVTGIRSLTSDKIPDGVMNAAQSIDVISKKTLDDQGTTRLQDALKNVPGITLNAGEGSARGDTVNLRGFPAFNDFFLDGIRDAAITSRDSFDLESIEVLKGPSAVLFGRGSTGGAINQVSKAPTLAPIYAATLMAGTKSLARATADIDMPISSNAAIRVNAMGEHSQVTDRDDVFHHRWGFAPSISWGIGGRDQLTLSYYHFEENNRQDTGIPFVNGRPAPVKRSNFYGLDSDRARSNVDLVTARYRHSFTDDIQISNTFRYANYHFLNRVNSAHFGYFDSPGAPT
ncbi:MAG TPA: TonB-dependent receptor plug domain-containing protein, partial [Vicinamibacterales bacterium]